MRFAIPPLEAQSPLFIDPDQDARTTNPAILTPYEKELLHRAGASARPAKGVAWIF
jgi:hypothetical protein